jgi:ABC-type polar amino acid transport system, ATPase component
MVKLTDKKKTMPSSLSGGERQRVAIAYIIQSMENKAREKEINNLRINGINKQAFYSLCYYENRIMIIMTLLCCLMGYVVLLSLI